MTTTTRKPVAHPGVAIVLRRMFAHLADTLPEELHEIPRGGWQRHLQQRFAEAAEAFIAGEHPPQVWIGPGNRPVFPADTGPNPRGEPMRSKKS